MGDFGGDGEKLEPRAHRGRTGRQCDPGQDGERLGAFLRTARERVPIRQESAYQAGRTGPGAGGRRKSCESENSVREGSGEVEPRLRTKTPQSPCFAGTDR